MTEEQIFKDRFPEYCVGEKCLSPYFDLFQIGFEEGENQNKELQGKNDRLIALLNAERKKQEETCESFRNLIKELQEEKARLKKDSEENQDLTTIAYMQGASKYKTKLDEAKTIIQDLLSNSDEYARQRAMDFLKGE